LTRSRNDNAQGADVATTGDSPLERVGRAVAERRVEVGLLSQRELAKAAAVGLNTAGQLERGQTFPVAANRSKLEDALQWPRGTLDALRRGRPVPQPQPRPAPARTEPVPPAGDARTTVRALGIAKGVAAVAGACTRILAAQGGDAQALAALSDLENQLLELESLIAASLPHVTGSSFNETMAALAQIREYRDAIRSAAGDPTVSAAAPGTTLASAKS
jgi:hypothetical protein